MRRLLQVAEGSVYIKQLAIHHSPSATESTGHQNPFLSTDDESVSKGTTRQTAGEREDYLAYICGMAGQLQASDGKRDVECGPRCHTDHLLTCLACLLAGNHTHSVFTW